MAWMMVVGWGGALEKGERTMKKSSSGGSKVNNDTEQEISFFVCCMTRESLEAIRWLFKSRVFLVTP